MEDQDIQEWYRRYGPVVLHRARAILGSEADALDILHDVFETVLARRALLRQRGVSVSWFYQVTTNRALNRIRNSTTRRNLLDAAGRATDDVLRASQQSTQEATHLARKVLESLPEELAEIAVYYYLDEMTQEEIASLISCSRRNVSHKLARIRELLAAWECAA